MSAIITVEGSAEKQVSPRENQSPVKRMPNRIYFSPEGRFMVVEIPKNGPPYGAYSEALRKHEDGLQTFKGEGLTFSNPNFLERQIGFQRRQLQMQGDLLLAPTEIFRVVDLHGDDKSSVEFIHTIELGVQKGYCRYAVDSSEGISLLDLGTGGPTLYDNQFMLVSGIPLTILLHGDPLGTFPVDTKAQV